MTNRLSFKVVKTKEMNQVIDKIWSIITNNPHLISGDSIQVDMKDNNIAITGLTERGVDFIKSKFTIK